VKRVYRSRIVAAVAIVTLAQLGLPPSSDGAELPDDSYYQLDVVLETQAGETLRFAEMQGKPVIVAMFYASCPQVCPMTIGTIRAIEGQVPPGHRSRLRVLMITLDPERDTPDELAALADGHRVNDERWRFARTAPSDVRPLAAVLGVQYRNLPDGNINHSTLILLLDADGREVARTGKLGVPDPAFVQKLVALVAAD
jgi:protein SCO1/2